MLRKNMWVCSLSLALLIGFFIHFSVNALTVGINATCKVWKPWWSSQTRAKGRVTWIHPTTGGDLIVPHPHRVDYSVYARVGDQIPDSQMDSAGFMSNKRFTTPDSRTAFQKGTPRWAGDAYASSSISVHNDAENWRFCADPPP